MRKTEPLDGSVSRQQTDDRATEQPPLAGAYLTDGGALYRVANLLRDRASGETFLELEDCSTLELVLCPVRTVLGLRAVTPARPFCP